MKDFVYDPDSWHNSTMARILYPDAWVISIVGTAVVAGGAEWKVELLF